MSGHWHVIRPEASFLEWCRSSGSRSPRSVALRAQGHAVKDTAIDLDLEELEADVESFQRAAGVDDR